MSKPSTAPIRYIRKPRLKADGLSILAEESKGKITAFVVCYLDNPAVTFPVKNNKIELAFKDAEKYAAKLITQTTDARPNKQDSRPNNRRGNKGL